LKIQGVYFIQLSKVPTTKLQQE